MAILPLKIPGQSDLNCIREHLTELLNARCGSLNHLPDYGLPDIGEIYQGLPYSLQKLSRAVIAVIENYEPRLKDVSVTVKPVQENEAVLCLEICACMSNQQKVFFNTYFLSGGKAVIRS